MRDAVEIPITPKIQAQLDAMPDRHPGTQPKIWSAEDDAFLLAAWRVKRQIDIARYLKVGVNLARKRYEMLTHGKG